MIGAAETKLDLKALLERHLDHPVSDVSVEKSYSCLIGLFHAVLGPSAVIPDTPQVKKVYDDDPDSIF